MDISLKTIVQIFERWRNNQIIKLIVQKMLINIYVLKNIFIWDPKWASPDFKIGNITSKPAE